MPSPAPVTLDLALLRAVLDRLIPPDDWPGAVDAGVDHYVVHQLAQAYPARANEVAAGLATLDMSPAGTFTRLAPAAQDALLRSHERETWFELLVNLAAEGFYADPGNGGNRGGVSWRMVGYAPNRFSFRLPSSPRPILR